MRTHLFCNQYRQFIANTIFFCHYIGGSIGSNGKFSHRKGIMMEQHIFSDIFFIFFFVFKITAGIISNHTILEMNLQILITQFLKINLTDMKHTCRACKSRRSKHFPHRNVHICHTVFKNRLFLRILQFSQAHCQICSIAVFSKDVYLAALIQCVYDSLLNSLI